MKVNVRIKLPSCNYSGAWTHLGVMMKKLTLTIAVSGLLSSAAYANHHMDKVSHSFTSLDENKDGVIMMEEAKNKPIADYFSDMDKDTNEQISKSEFIAYMQNNKQAFASQMKDKVAMTKSKADSAINASPKELNTQETETYTSDNGMGDADVRNNGEMAGTHDAKMKAAKAFAKVDTDNDGMVTKEEAQMAGAQQAFIDMDSNQDGMVSKEEFVTHHQQMSE